VVEAVALLLALEVPAVQAAAVQAETIHLVMV